MVTALAAELAAVAQLQLLARGEPRRQAQFGHHRVVGDRRAVDRERGAAIGKRKVGDLAAIPEARR